MTRNLERQRPRRLEILHAIVRAYIDTGEPVGSSEVSRRRRSALSPASIRNVMSELAEEGYLSQPHPSAGRVPTEKAFRSYVSGIQPERAPGPETGRLRREFQDIHTVEERVERSSHLLTELTRNVGIAAAIPPTAQVLDQIELLPLADQRVLMILATRDHLVRHRVVALEEPATAEELNNIRNFVNRNFSGWQLGAARRELLRRMSEERDLYAAAARQLQWLCQAGLLDGGSSPEVHMEGASNLLGLDLHLTRETMRELLGALEEKRRVVELLDHFLDQPPGELEVHIGLGEAHPAMKDLSLIGITVAMPSGLPTKVAVLGPMRMNYERVMSAVLGTSAALSDSYL